MWSATKEKSNPLSSRDDVIRAVTTMLSALDAQFPAGQAQFTLGDTCAHYDTNIAGMEGLSRALWGLFPLWAGGEETPFAEKYIQAIKLGTDPDSPQYWGDTGPYDQRLVEMAAYGLGLALLQTRLTDVFSQKELANFHRWLNQITDAQMPDSNWNYFAIIVQLGFKRAGLAFDQAAIDRRFAMMEAYYLGEGWYSDGPGRPKDYYISMAFHFYGLLYATLSPDDAERAATLRERSRLFARDFIYMSAADGSSVPFGRSLTYRFAMIAFWSAVAFSGVDEFSPGVVKGLILRHLRWWQQQPIFDRDGILTLGFAYPNLAMCEDYNSPGSPYVNPEAKYTKFAYSSRFGFTLERGRYGLKHAACDSMLLLSDNDNYWRGRRECEEVTVAENAIFCRWSPWSDVHIRTWLIPCGDWHVRVHHIASARRLQSVEGGFAVLKAEPCLEAGSSLILASNGSSMIANLAPGIARQGEAVITPPNSSIMFAPCAAIPTLTTELAPGEHWLACAVIASAEINKVFADMPLLIRQDRRFIIMDSQKETQQTIYF